MKRALLAAIMLSIMLALSGCGGGSDNSPPPTFITDILSDPALDGDIVETSPGVFTVTQGPLSVRAGINPFTSLEYRAFLGFPLTGVGGVPGNAIIVSATLNIVIDRIVPQLPTDTIPIRIELVSFPTQLQDTNINLLLQPALATTTIIPPISQADVGFNVAVDVTSLMVEAQRRGLLDFQIRIVEDDFVPFYPGLIEINDDTLPPVLQVVYF